MRIRPHWRESVAAAVLLLPRTAASIPLYLAASAVLAGVTFKRLNSVVVLSAALMFAVCSYCLNAQVSLVSLTAFVIECALIFPMLVFACSPANISRDKSLIFTFNIALTVLSITNLVLEHGFPFRVPYVHYLPDFYAAFWGNGGVKLITLSGFLGLATWLAVPDCKKGFQVGKFCAFLNFLVPSYNIGIACGSAGLFLALFAKRKIRKDRGVILVAGAFSLLMVLPYFLGRINSINTGFEDEFGSHPKIFAYQTVGALFEDSPQVLIAGTSLGNFSGTAALWASEHVSSTAAHSRPEIPGLHVSQYFRAHLGSAVQMMEKEPWMFASSFNKPYSSLSTLVAELGIFAGGALFVSVIWRVLASRATAEFRVAVAVSVALLLAIDHLHTNALFWGVLSIGVVSASAEVTSDA